MARLLIIDDDKMMCRILSDIGKNMGHYTSCAYSIKEGIEEVLAGRYDIVFLDVGLPDGNGLDVLPRIREAPSSPEVIIITGDGNPNGAELAIRNGAWDYIEKPSPLDSMRLPLVRALQYREHKNARMKAAADGKGVMSLRRDGIVGKSNQIMSCLHQVAQAASSEANVLITGETGTGKELFAWAIHDNSSRSGKPFVVVDCAALPETLVESMLFGHEKGVFTGADKPQEGMIKQAHNGTLVLDEVGELPLSVQKAFLRVLQERRFRPLGGKSEIYSDFRLLAVTNRDLEEMVAEGQFRKDLFFRLRSLAIDLPPLRERLDDLKALALYHMTKLCDRYGIGTKGFSPEFLRALTDYDWPGNVRELMHCMERTLAAACDEPVLYPDHLPIHIRIKVVQASVGKALSGKGKPEVVPGSDKGFPTLGDFRDTAIAKAEKEYLEGLIALEGIDILSACRISGLSRPRLYALLKKYGLSRQRQWGVHSEP